MGEHQSSFLRVNLVDRVINRTFGLVVRLGFGLSHNFLLEVRGRKSGRIYSTPVNLLEYGGKRYLVAPRGDTQWVRNVIASQKATLMKGTRRENIRLQLIAVEARAEILKVYLDTHKLTVQRYFPIPAGSPVEKFQPSASRYPVFEVTAQ